MAIGNRTEALPTIFFPIARMFSQFLRILVMIYVRILCSEVFTYTITKPFPKIWPLTFNIFYRGAWGEVLDKSKVAYKCVKSNSSQVLGVRGFPGKT